MKIRKEKPMFADRANIYIRSGKGGSGHVSFRRELYVPNGGPDGGDGGRGGDVIFAVDEGMNTLADYRHKRKYKAGDGEEGGKRRCHGADGEGKRMKRRYIRRKRWKRIPRCLSGCMMPGQPLQEYTRRK